MSSNSPKLGNQVKTRSASTSSTGKPTIASNASSTPLTSEEFHAVISTIQKTQNDTLAHYKSFSSSLNTKLNELKTSVDLLSSQIVQLKSENASLRLDLTALNNKVLALESNETKTSTSTDQLPQLLLEIS
jgi:peptidoglycan hydrolase CwlO-like protein